jgi:hypothetical protein
MANYGLAPDGSGNNGTGNIPFTGWTVVLGPSTGTPANNVGDTGGVVQRTGIQQGDDRISKMLRNGGFTAGTTELLFNLIGAAAGVTATRNKSQIRGGPSFGTATSQENLSGLIPIDVIPLVNRATTASDVTAFKALMRRNVFPSAYAADVSGNGGGGKVGR